MRNIFLVLCLCVIPFSTLQGQELVPNGDFSAGMNAEWIIGDWGTGASVNAVANGAFSCNITSIGAASWNVFFYHFEDIQLTGGVTYIFEFNAHATAPSYVETGAKTVGQNITPYIDVFDSIGTTDSTYSGTFTPTADDDSGQVFWDLGFGNVPLGATIYISKVSIQAASSAVVSKVSANANAPFARVTRNGVSINFIQPAKAEMRLYNLQGALIADYSSMLKSLSAGTHQIDLSTHSVSNGTYLLKISNGLQTQSMTINLVK